jgi:hypothetical protein
LLELLKPLVEKYGVSIIVVHHLNQGQSPDPLQLISGSEGLVGVVDGTLVLRRERGKTAASLHVAGKDIEEEKEHALKWDDEVKNWVFAGDTAELRMSDQRREIRNALRMLGVQCRQMARGCTPARCAPSPSRAISASYAIPHAADYRYRFCAAY